MANLRLFLTHKLQDTLGQVIARGYRMFTVARYVQQYKLDYLKTSLAARYY